MATDPQFVAALSHGLEILRCFTQDQPVLTNGALARMTGMPRSSVSRLTHTLVKVGYLEYDSDSGAYRPGLAVLALQPAVLAGARIQESIAPHMLELARQVGARVLLTVYESYGLTVVHGVCTNPEIGPPKAVGLRYSMPRWAMGRAYVASCCGHEREKILIHLARGDERRSAEMRNELDHAVHTYRNQGYCTSLGEGRPGNNSISVPLNLPHLGRRLLLACGGPADRLPERDLHRRVAPLLTRKAREIERCSTDLRSQAGARNHGRGYRPANPSVIRAA
jgi:DNA-binding IclR family transcriptional regulator